jgi:hypothetical protein
MEISQSAEELNDSRVMDTLSAATKAGFTQQVNDEDGHVLCAVPDTMKLVDIFPNGSWEFQDVDEDGEMKTMSGDSAVMLALYLHGDNAKIFEENEKA